MQFDKCQEAEQARMEFFKHTLQTLKRTLDIHSNQRWTNTLNHPWDVVWYNYNELLYIMFGNNSHTMYAYNWGDVDSTMARTYNIILLHVSYIPV